MWLRHTVVEYRRRLRLVGDRSKLRVEMPPYFVTSRYRRSFRPNDPRTCRPPRTQPVHPGVVPSEPEVPFGATTNPIVAVRQSILPLDRPVPTRLPADELEYRGAWRTRSVLLARRFARRERRSDGPQISLVIAVAPIVIPLYQPSHRLWELGPSYRGTVRFCPFHICLSGHTCFQRMPHGAEQAQQCKQRGADHEITRAFHTSSPPTALRALLFYWVEAEAGPIPL